MNYKQHGILLASMLSLNLAVQAKFPSVVAIIVTSSTAGVSSVHQDDVRQAVRHERRVELALEGLRYFDVLRWGIAKQELNHTFTGVKLSDNPSARNYRGSGSSASPVDKDGCYQFETRTWFDHNRYFELN